MGEAVVPEEPKDGEAPKKDEAPKAAESQLGGWVKAAGDKVVPLLVSAVVSVGFVAFAGKAILWARFEAIQVPGEQVVKAVPQGEAVATGASLLLIFGVLGVLAVLTVYMIDSSGRATADMSRGVLAVVAAEALVAVWLTAGESLPDRVVASEVVLLTLGAILWATYVAKLARGKKFAGLQKDEFKRKPNGAFYRTGKRTQCTGDGSCCDEPTSGFTRKELWTVLGAALAIAIAGFVVAWLVHPVRDWRWVVAVGLFGGVLVGVVIAFGHSYRKKERDATTKEKTTTAATQGKTQAETDEKGTEAHGGGSGDPAPPPGEGPGDADATEAWARAERQAGRLGALLARLISQFRAGVGSSEPSPTILVVAEAAVEPPAEDAGDHKGDGADESTDPQTGLDLTGWGVLFALACSAVLIVVPWWVLNEWWLGVSLIVAVLVGAGLWRIAGMGGKRFAWFGLAVFISVPLCGTVMMMTRNLDEPKVQPLALIRTTDGPDEAIEGLYVTETSDRVYFANVATEGCSNEVTPNSGRLLWVPSKEVISTEIGPLQSVGDAGRSALEMSHELTPGVETSGATFDIAPAAAPPAAGTEPPASGGTEASGAGGAAGPTGPAGGTGTDSRLQNLGPAVRSDFGVGLRVEPETVSPGEEATLRLSKKNENENVDGFGESRDARNLWLGGRRLDISKEPAGKAAGAEYIELENERLIKLEKEAVYVKASDGSFVPKDKAVEGKIKDLGPFVLIEDPAVAAPEEGSDSLHVKVRKEAGRWIVDEKKTLILAGGTSEGRTREEEKQPIQGQPLMRQAWHSDHIRFHVPTDARSGVISVGCDQLSGAPLLQVRHKPEARIAVRVPSHRSVLTFSGRPSFAGPPAHALPPADDGRPAPNLIRSWWVDGVRQGHGELVHLRLTPRREPYTVELKVTDREGNSDTAKLRILRLPAADLTHLRKTWRKPRDPALLRTRRQLRTIVEDEKPAAVELDGYAGRGVANDVRSSLRFDGLVRQYLLHDRHPREDHKGESLAEKEAAAGENAAAEERRPIPIEEMGHGETCLPRWRATAARAHVDLFLLDQGVVVKPVAHCHALVRRQILWDPPTAAERRAEAKGRVHEELSKARREAAEARRELAKARREAGE